MSCYVSENVEIGTVVHNVPHTYYKPHFIAKILFTPMCCKKSEKWHFYKIQLQCDLIFFRGMKNGLCLPLCYMTYIISTSQKLMRH